MAALMLAGCSSSAATGSPQQSTSPTRDPTAAITGVPDSAIPSFSVAPQPTRSRAPTARYDLTPNWKLIKHDLEKNFKGQCVLKFSCVAHENFTSATIEASALGAPYSEIKFKVDIRYLQLKEGVELLLSKYAAFFSLSRVSQLQFSEWVSDHFDLLAVGDEARIKIGGKIPLLLARPDPKEWIFTVGTS
jgi:hypothetical protein